MTKIEELEQRIALLEYQLLEHHKIYYLLFNLAFRHDDQLRLAVAETLRRIVQNPSEKVPIPPYVEIQLRLLRDGLLAPPPQDMVELYARPPVRPVDK